MSPNLVFLPFQVFGFLSMELNWMRRDHLGRHRSRHRSRPSARSCGDLLDLVGRHGCNLVVHYEQACPCRLMRTREYDLIHSDLFHVGSVHWSLAHGSLFRGGRDGSYHDGYLQQILIYPYMRASLAKLGLYADFDEPGHRRLVHNGVA